MTGRRPYDPAGDAVAELDHWSRKHYRFKVETNGGVQPGDGPYITLSAGGRTVCVGEYDLIEQDEEDDVTRWPTTAELIHEALRLWHADRTPKFYHVMHYGDAPETLPAGSSWRWWTRPENRTVMSYVWATGEQDAIAVVRGAVVGEFRLAELWERVPPAARTEQTGKQTGTAGV